MTLQDQIVATLISVWEGDTMTHRIEEGKAVVFFENEHAYHITESQLLTMNSFMRKRWEKAKEGIQEKYAHKNPISPDQTL